jgi:hypothetical protein
MSICFTFFQNQFFSNAMIDLLMVTLVNLFGICKDVILKCNKVLELSFFNNQLYSIS